MPDATPVYDYFKAAYSRDPKPFKVVWRSPIGSGQFFKRTVEGSAHATERMASKEVARLNSLVSACADCGKTIYPHEREARDERSFDSLCEKCFERTTGQVFAKGAA